MLWVSVRQTVPALPFFLYDEAVETSLQASRISGNILKLLSISLRNTRTSALEELGSSAEQALVQAQIVC